MFSRLTNFLNSNNRNEVIFVTEINLLILFKLTRQSQSFLNSKLGAREIRQFQNILEDFYL